MHTHPVLITGGASGIGLAVARACLANDWPVALLDMNPTTLAAAETALARPGMVITQAGSVADEAVVDALCTRAEATFGPLRGVVNSAGIGIDARALDTDTDAFRRVIEVNLIGSFVVSKAAAARMLANGGGSIVNIASVSGMMGNVGRTAYGATKGGVITMTKVMAVELGADGIRVNAMAPGPVETPMVRDMHSAEMRKGWIDTVPQRRYGMPEEIAAAVMFLLDDAASGYITGQVLAVDGGFTIGGVLKGVAPRQPARAAS